MLSPFSYLPHNTFIRLEITHFKKSLMPSLIAVNTALLLEAIAQYPAYV